MYSFFSSKDVFRTRNLVFMAFMVGFSAILSSFDVYITPALRLSFSYLPGAVASILFGPLAALTLGFVSDTVNYMVKPMGPYFFGYTLSAMVANFIHALFLYKKDIKVWRIVAARLLVILIVTFGLNGIWNIMFFGSSAGKFYSTARVIKNLVQLPFDTFLIYFFSKLVLELQKRYK